MHRYFNNVLPEAFMNYFTAVNTTHTYPTRFSNNMNYVFPVINNNYGLNSPSARCIHIWSSFSDDLKYMDYDEFKNTLSYILRFDYE